MMRIFNEFLLQKYLIFSAIIMTCPPLNILLTASKSKLQIFKPTTVSVIITMIRKPSKASCALDNIPANLLCDLLPVLAPIITHLVNAALSSGTFPSQLKSVVVMPLLKKLGSDVEVLKNYHPVSNLSFISKVIERVVASQILDHMRENNLLDAMQSVYRSGHSTETALFRVHSNIVSAIDKGRGVFLILLDLSATFNTVDHTILLSFHYDYVGLDGPALKLIETYMLQSELRAFPSRVYCLNLVNWLTFMLTFRFCLNNFQFSPMLPSTINSAGGRIPGIGFGSLSCWATWAGDCTVPFLSAVWDLSASDESMSTPKQIFISEKSILQHYKTTCRVLLVSSCHHISWWSA